ncbi:MAG: hypothetical protein JNL85_11750 [Rubrivivax sp.]|nr:hypothetical protein [Rubrivivax sp.]
MPRARHIPALLDIHAEDLAFLWGQRRAALDSPEQTLRDFAGLNERIEAHIQGLLVAPADALRQRLEATLADSADGNADRDEVFTAAVAALRCDDRTLAPQVIAEFSRASGPALLGLRDAMGQASPGRVVGELGNALANAKPSVAAAAAAALANHRRLAPDAPGLARLLLDDDAEVCAQAWAAAWRADRHATASQAATSMPSAPRAGSAGSAARPYREALARPEPAIRHEAWASAAWSGLAQAITPLRKAVADGDEVALQWLCILGTPEDTKAIGTATMALPSADKRCAALARYGHPAVLPTLVRWMESDDAVLAHAAGAAFMRITGTEIRGERRTLPVADDADDIDREMAPLVWMPDVAKARRLLEEQGPQWNAGIRWCAGRRMDGPLAADELAALDLQARWDAAARAAFAGRPISAPPPIC